MGRKRTMNYRELRTDFDEDPERADEEEGDEEDEDEDEEEEGEEGEAEPGAETEEGEEEGDEEEAPVKKKKPKAKPKPKRTRTVKVTRMRYVWGVFNNSHQMVASYEYPKKADAEAHAAKLMADKKSTHFVQPVKEAMEEKKEK